MKPSIPYVITYPGRRSGETLAVCRAPNGALLFAAVKRAGVWTKLRRIPASISRGLFHNRCSQRRARGLSVCRRCVPSLLQLELERRAKHPLVKR